MKNLMKRSFVFTSLAFGIMANAKNLDNSIKLSKVENKLMNLTLTKDSQKVYFRITDATGFSLYEERVEAHRFSKNYDFNSLKGGDYLLEFHSEKHVRKVPFKIVNDELIILKEEAEVYYKPVVKVNEDVVTISMLSFNESDTLKIEFYDGNELMLYSETVSGKNSIGKKLNIEKLESGDYTLILRSKGETYLKEIRKDS